MRQYWWLAAILLGTAYLWRRKRLGLGNYNCETCFPDDSRGQGFLPGQISDTYTCTKCDKARRSRSSSALPVPEYSGKGRGWDISNYYEDKLRASRGQW